MATSYETAIAWVSPRRLDGCWKPEMFRSEFLRLDEFLAETESLVPLGELVKLVRVKAINDNATWHVELSGIKRRFPGQEAEVRNLFALPDEAILVSRLWFNEPTVHYWNTSLFRGNGSVTDQYFVLVGDEKRSIAWLKKELDLPYAKLQLQRRAVGQVAASLTIEDLLDIRVQVLPLQAQSKASRDVIEETRVAASSLRPGRVRQGIELDNKSHEEKLKSLEAFLIDRDLFSVANIFYVEPATSSVNSDLFTVRSCKDKLQASPCFVPQDDPRVNQAWRDWFWNDTPSDRHKVFNSLVASAPLPTFLLMHTISSEPPLVLADSSKILLPSFATFRDTILPVLQADVGVEDQVWAGVWADVQASFSKRPPAHTETRNAESIANNHELEAELFRWSSEVYRPILAVRVVRDGKVTGAYLLVGDEQIRDPETVFARLDDIGVDLSEALTQSSTQLDEALRRESARRLSELMHRLSGPILNATDALQNIRDFLQLNPDAAARLVPDEVRARELAAMNRDENTDAYRVDSQLNAIQNAIEQIRNVAHRVKTLAKVEERLAPRDFSMWELFKEMVVSNRALAPLLFLDGVDVAVNADRDLVHVAMELILDNAIRELRERKTTQPRIDVRLAPTDRGVEIQVTDNALPVDKALRHDAMDEGVSTYFRSGKGSGYGLAIVRRTFERHGSDVSLFENMTSDGLRRPGVTFCAVLPQAKEGVR